MRRALSLALATLALVLGWAGLAYTLFGPLYSTASSTAISVDSAGSVIGSTAVSTTIGSTSLFASGVEPVTVFFLSLMALGYLVVLAGAVLTWRGRPHGRTAMAIAVIPMTGLNFLSFGLVLTLPATLAALFATLAARSQSGVPQASNSAAPDSRGKRR